MENLKQSAISKSRSYTACLSEAHRMLFDNIKLIFSRSWMYCAALGQEASVSIPDMRTVQIAREKIEAVMNGESSDSVDTEWLETLSPSYNSLAVADLERFSGLPADYLRQVPSFFLDHADFFSHFLMAAQFTCVDGVVYPCLTLFYKHPSRG